MKKLVTILFLLFIGLGAISPSLADIFIVQSRSVSDIYGDSIGKQMKELHPDWAVHSLNLRDFSMDRFSQSGSITMRRAYERTEPFSNLAILGDEAFSQNTDHPNVLDTQPLISHSGTGLASPEAILEAITMVLQSASHVRSVYYVFSDTSHLSQARLREFENLTVNNRAIDLVSFDIERTMELRSQLLKINRYHNDPGVIINNIFRITDEDSFSVVYSDFVDSVITDINKIHVEVGILKSEQSLAIGVGARPESVARMLDATIRGEEVPSLESEIGVNLERLFRLRLNSFVLQQGENISHVRAGNYER